MQVHLIDGTFELFRCHFSPQARKDRKANKGLTAEGVEVAAVRGLLRAFNAQLARADTTHVAVAFDRVIESFRNDLFDGYKTGAGIEPALLGQFPLAEQAARSMGLVVWPMVKFEADDALATAAALYAPDAERVVLCSPDKDFAQCVRGSSVVLWDRIRDKIYDEAGVIEKFGVPPASIPDWLALVGDKADGIPGIPRWGAKSAATVLARYGTIDEIPSDVEQWDVTVRGAASLAQELEGRRGEAALYKTLATLQTDVPIEHDLADLEWRGADREALADLCARIEFDRFTERVTYA